MMMLDSGTISPRASSCSTGNLPIGHNFNSAARSAGLERSTEFGLNGVSFSYSAISAFQQNDASGWKCSVSDMGTPDDCWPRAARQQDETEAGYSTLHADYFLGEPPSCRRPSPRHFRCALLRRLEHRRRQYRVNMQRRCTA